MTTIQMTVDSILMFIAPYLSQEKKMVFNLVRYAKKQNGYHCNHPPACIILETAKMDAESENRVINGLNLVLVTWYFYVTNIYLYI